MSEYQNEGEQSCAERCAGLLTLTPKQRQLVLSGVFDDLYSRAQESGIGVKGRKFDYTKESGLSLHEYSRDPFQPEYKSLNICLTGYRWAINFENQGEEGLRLGKYNPQTRRLEDCYAVINNPMSEERQLMEPSLLDGRRVPVTTALEVVTDGITSIEQELNLR